MKVTLLNLLALCLLLCGGCAGNSREPAATEAAAEPSATAGAASFAALRDSELRQVFIGPADFSQLRVAVKHRTKVDRQWQVSPAEAALLQQVIREEFTAALTADGVFSIVDSPEQAQVVVTAALESIRPGVAGKKNNGDSNSNGKRNSNGNGTGTGTGADNNSETATGGAVTASLTVTDRRTGAIVLRALETRATDNIGAFYQIDSVQPAVALVCRAWGDSLRRGLLDLRKKASAVPI